MFKGLGWIEGGDRRGGGVLELQCMLKEMPKTSMSLPVHHMSLNDVLIQDHKCLFFAFESAIS